jgi:hypothetical protein
MSILVPLATARVIQEALEREQAEVLGQSRYGGCGECQATFLSFCLAPTLGPRVGAFQKVGYKAALTKTAPGR